jgi:glycosyltransferase involved in cell wall biosynthesis
MNRHIVVINQFALPRTEAGGTRHFDLFSRLAGWTSLIVAGDRNHYTQRRFATNDQRFRLVRVPPQSGGGLERLITWCFFAVKAFAITVTRRRLDLAFGSSPQPLAALAGLLAARMRRVPFVLEVRDLWPESMVAIGAIRRGGVPHLLFSALERILVHGACRIVCVTDGWQDHFERLGVPADRLIVVPNGAEFADFVAPIHKEELRRRQNITGFTAVFAGAHGPKDGLDLVLDAAAELKDIRFLLIGSGSAKPSAIERARVAGLRNVQFRDPVSKAELPALLRACDVGIHSVNPLSVFESGMSPNKLFDYMAAELPIVSNAAMPLRGIVGDGECGSIGRPDSLAAGLAFVRNASTDQRTAWAQNGLRILNERFSRSAAAETLNRCLNTAVYTTTRRRST